MKGGRLSPEEERFITSHATLYGPGYVARQMGVIFHQDESYWSRYVVLNYQKRFRKFL